MNEGLGFEPTKAVDHLRAQDDILAGIIDAVGPFLLIDNRPLLRALPGLRPDSRGDPRRLRG